MGIDTVGDVCRPVSQYELHGLQGDACIIHECGACMPPVMGEMRLTESSRAFERFQACSLSLSYVSMGFPSHVSIFLFVVHGFDKGEYFFCNGDHPVLSGSGLHAAHHVGLVQEYVFRAYLQ